MRRRRRSAGIFLLRARLAFVLGVVLAFSVLVIFTYDFWTVAITASSLFMLTAVAMIFWGRGVLEAPISPVFGAIVFPIAWGLIQIGTGHSVYPHATWMSLIGYGEAACVFWLALLLCQSERIRRRARMAAGIFGAALALAALLQMFSSPLAVYWLIPITPAEQGMGPFQNPDHYAAFMELLLPIAAWEALRGGRSAALYGVMTGLMFASIIATVSRAGTVTASVEIAVLFLFSVLRRRRLELRPSRFAAVVLVGVVALLGAAAGVNLVVGKFQAKDQFAGRREYFHSSIEMAKTKPWLGYGLGTWPSVYPRFATFDPGAIANHAHDEWVEWLSEGGIPLFVIFVAIAVRSGWLSWKVPAALGIPAVFLHSLVEFPLRENPIPLVLMAVFGWAEATAAQETENSASRTRAHGDVRDSAPGRRSEAAAQPERGAEDVTDEDKQ